jgi:NitT/TauT family transport system permease protein
MASNTDRATRDMAWLARRLRIDDWIYPTAAIVAFVVLWDVSVRIFNVKTVVLPSPGQVYDSLIADWGELAPHMLFTIYEIVAGFALSVVVGIALAIAIVTWRPIEKSIYPILVGSQVIPKIALAPLFVIWFGFGIEPKILIAFLIAFFPVVISTVVGLRSLEIEKLYLARSMGASELQMFFKIKLPNAMPNVFAGLKLSITAAVIGAIVGEYIGADRGIGRVLLEANGDMETELLFAGIVLLSITGVILFLIIDGLERVMIRWHVSQRLREQPMP